MKRRLFYLYAFIVVAVLLSSAKLLKGNRINGDVCTKNCQEMKKDKGLELFLPTHFISVIK